MGDMTLWQAVHLCDPEAERVIRADAAAKERERIASRFDREAAFHESVGQNAVFFRSWAREIRDNEIDDDLPAIERGEHTRDQT